MIELHHGDCLEVMAGMPAGSVDAVVTDPPYGTRVDRDGYGRRQLYHGQQHIKGDSDLSLMAAMLGLAPRLLKPNSWVALFCSPKRHAEAAAICANKGFCVAGEVVWDKESPGLGGGIRYQHEMVLLCKFGNPAGRAALFSVLRGQVKRNQRFDGHSHEKPLSVMTALVRYCSNDGDCVLDPFAGSGTTGVACMKTGRRCILIESDERWIPVARRRLAAAETPLFAAIPADASRSTGLDLTE